MIITITNTISTLLKMGDGLVLPVLQSAEIGNVADNKIVIVYDLAMNESIIPAVTDYSVDDGAANVVTDVTISGTDVTLTLTNDVVFGDTVVVSYVPGVNRLQSVANGKAGALTDSSVTNNVS